MMCRKSDQPPQFVATEALPSYFREKGVAFRAFDPLSLGFGEGNDQYRFYPYPAPAEDETMGVFCEWSTEDFFEVDSGPHLAIGMRGPTREDPHRGRGLAIGILANCAINPDDPDHPALLFRGCPDPPGGPSFFVEDFTINEGIAPIREWQLSPGRDLPALKGYGMYRVDIHVSANRVWAGVWKVTRDGKDSRYDFLGEVSCPGMYPGQAEDAWPDTREDPADSGVGNFFIGSGFAAPRTRSRIDTIIVAHWKDRSIF